MKTLTQLGGWFIVILVAVLLWNMTFGDGIRASGRV
jgi:hypothetical protein